jgi:mercuric ion transport protein
LAAVGASLCCVAPLVLVTLGAWMSTLTQLEPLRPLFVALTLGLLALAWHKLYRPPPIRAYEPGTSCADTVLQRQQLIFWLVAVPLLLLVAFPWYAWLFY